ncbi:hypothetical protein KCP76_03560 [Salmonella enterica subsp. enterica serovar Weltevreden]|nr:hypothetical protein KCP76_03560 [Salmonella enterica subsp. enterica serovar Weltevreden]
MTLLTSGEKQTRSRLPLVTAISTAQTMGWGSRSFLWRAASPLRGFMFA